MSQRIDPDVAVSVMRAAGYEPIVEYPGAGEKWECLCQGCGETREPRYSAVARGIKCGVCEGNVPYSNERATAIMCQRGFKPLGPYPGNANTPWPSRCIAEGHDVSPRFHQVNRRNVRCRECVHIESRIDADVAAAFMRESGWEPLDPYPGSSTPWRCRCHVCKTVRTPSYAAVRKGHGCGSCVGVGALDTDVAEARMLAGGARPLEPFDKASTKWKCECLTCHKIIYPRLNQLTQGYGACGYCAGNARFETDEATEMMREAGYEPLVPYPGSSKAWKARCMGCQTIRQPTLTSIRSKNARCAVCWGRTQSIDAEQAAEVMRGAGFEPLEAYRRSDAPWLCRCMGCDAEVSPEYSMVRLGIGGCRACRLNLHAPGRSAGLYVMTHKDLQAVKVGIGVVRADLFPRVRCHERRGWVEVTRWSGFDDLRVVAGVERLVLKRWRGEGIAGFVGRSLMPQGGWSETAPLKRVNVEDLVGMMTVSLGEVAAGLPVVSAGSGWMAA